jgi:tRNA pseudouridine55 synthase|tara:strand:- start:2367 stop:3080 length:714 start_codon:yes stop_codon:yes gene_type:complete
LSNLTPCNFNSTTNFNAGELILVNKPLEWSSFDIVKKLRNILKKTLQTKKLKVGHAGTLDPLATGLLIICTGKYTKKIEQLQAKMKTYIGTFTLGTTTPSYDLETDIDKIYPTSQITKDLLTKTAQKFVGDLLQKPPVFSALKKDGKRLYEYARENKKVEVKEREVTIHSFEITKIDIPIIHFKISCGKGTYIRSLAHDFGLALNSGAHLSKLCRTKIGNYDLENAYELQEIEKKFK